MPKFVADSSVSPTGLKWAAPSTGSLSLIEPTSIAFTGTSASSTAGKTIFSACSSLSINGVFSSSFDNYLIMTAPFSQSIDVMVYIRLRASGSDTSINYSNSSYFQNAGGAVTANVDVNDKLYLSQPAGTQGTAMTYLQNPNLASATIMFGSSSRLTQASYRAGSQSDSTQFDGFTVFLASGDVTGTIRVYGYKN